MNRSSRLPLFAATSSETRCGRTSSKEPRTGAGPCSGIAGIQAIAAGYLLGPSRRRRIGSIMSMNRRRKPKWRHCEGRCNGAYPSAVRPGNRPRLASSGSNWPHGRGAAPGNLGPTATPHVLAEIRSRPHFSHPAVYRGCSARNCRRAALTATSSGNASAMSASSRTTRSLSA